MVWIATADGRGECDCSFRAGPPGFVQVLDPGRWTLGPCAPPGWVSGGGGRRPRRR